ncbi:alpha/beta fold hydrolase [Mycobacterium sp. P7213]|uniref:alpha/beta fold hydrolase n=1 Tax=Mycobacterium sp. P7213 TaxID=2478465 RepID=UPI000F63BB68|nr:alpha/beta hydrolase [Mycobacterium sp. P7213]
MVARKPRLRTVSDDPARVEYRTVHGYRRAYRVAGDGPPLLLIHGIGDNSSTWKPLIPLLAQKYTVIAPDLLGHGLSDQPRADYSVAAFANGMRDLLSVLNCDRVTVIGHSLGGGVAMQFCYQYPQMVERLVLVAAGGVTREVNPALRLASLPAAPQALAALSVPGFETALRMVRGRLDKTNLPALLVDLPEILRVLGDLRSPNKRAAFVRTLRAVVDWRGQMVTMLDRSYLTERLPIMIVWGTHDLVLPYSHAKLAHAAMPHSRLETFFDSGHFPFRDDPLRFADLVDDFITSTVPLDFDLERWRRLLADGAPAPAAADPDAELLRALTDGRSAT